MNRKPFIVILIGNSNVGKTSLSKCFAYDNYDESKNKPTIGADHFRKSVLVNGIPIPIRIVDTAGQEAHKAVPRQFYRNADAVIFVYDVTDIKSFLKLPDWVEDVRQFGCNIKCRVMVGNKSDLEDQRQVFRVDGEIFAENHNMLFEEVSASNSSKPLVDQLFVAIAEELVDLAKVHLTIKRDSWANKLSLTLLLIGNPSVGKSCLAKTYAMSKFGDTTPKWTRGMMAFYKNIDVDGGVVSIKILDFPRQGPTAVLDQQYFQHENTIIVFVYDVTDKTSLGGLGRYLPIFGKLGSNVLLKVLIGNKTDKMIERMVPQRIGEAAAKKHDMMYLELSARDSLLTAKGFNEIARTVWNNERQRIMNEQPEEPKVEETLPEVETVQLHETAPKKWTWCWSQ